MIAASRHQHVCDQFGGDRCPTLICLGGQPDMSAARRAWGWVSFLPFLSCLAYGKFGITAVIRRADAVRHAWIMMRSSMRPWRMQVLCEPTPRFHSHVLLLDRVISGEDFSAQNH